MLLMRWQLAYPGTAVPLMDKVFGADSAFMPSGYMVPDFYNSLLVESVGSHCSQLVLSRYELFELLASQRRRNVSISLLAGTLVNRCLGVNGPFSADDRHLSNSTFSISHLWTVYIFSSCSGARPRSERTV